MTWNAERAEFRRFACKQVSSCSLRHVRFDHDLTLKITLNYLRDDRYRNSCKSDSFSRNALCPRYSSPWRVAASKVKSRAINNLVGARLYDAFSEIDYQRRTYLEVGGPHDESNAD